MSNPAVRFSKAALAAARAPLTGSAEAQAALLASERVADLSNVIEAHLPGFLGSQTSPLLGGTVWHALVWLTGASCAAFVVLRRSKSGKVGAAAALVAAVVTDGASTYLEKLWTTFMGALTSVVTALQAPNEDAAVQHRGGA